MDKSSTTWTEPTLIVFKALDTENTFQEHVNSVMDAISRRITDPIPFWFQDLGYFPCKYTKITNDKAVEGLLRGLLQMRLLYKG